MPDPATAPSDANISLAITRILDAPRPLVFRVWSSAEHMVRWFGPKGFTVPSCRVDFRPGGAWAASIRSPEGDVYGCHGIYTEIVAPERLGFTFTWDEDGALDTKVMVLFEALGERTRLTFTQAPFRSIEDRDSHLGGWGECMDRLAIYATKSREQLG